MSKISAAALGTQPIGPLLVKQAVPASIGILVMSLNVLVDSIFVGNWIGALGIAAINVVLPVSFFIAGVIVWNLDLPTIIRENKNTVFHDLKSGWREFSSRSWVVTIVIAFALINTAYESLLQVLGPLNFSKMESGPQFWSFNLAALTAGMLTGSIISLKVHFSRPLLFAMLIISATAIWDFSLALKTPLWISLFCAFLAGIAVDIFMVIWNTSLQTHIPEESYSRVVAYDAFGSFGLSPLGIAVAGPLAQFFGVSTMIYVTGAMTLLAALAALLVKSVRDLKPVASA